MNPFQALILGIVEGLTEYLPVSSTGHFILVSHWLGLDRDSPGGRLGAFEVVIQLGAILAVVLHYRKLLAERLGGLFRNEPRARDLAMALAVGFLPAGIVGFALHSAIKRHLFGPIPVIIGLTVGGVVMIAVEAWRKRAEIHGLDGLEHVTLRRAFAIGVGQCFSLWPGTSRSMSTIVAGQLTGLSTSTAAEFSFLLALPTLGAATLYELLKSRHELLDHSGGGLTLGIGLVVSFFVAWGVIAAFLRYLRTFGLAPFGVYRILLGAAVFVLLR